MPTFIPRFNLYASDGVTLLYTFIAVQATNAPQSLNKNTVIEGIRGQGCIVITGSTSAWDLTINGVFLGSNYEAIVILMDALEAAIPIGTKFVLKIDKTPSTTYSYNVIRITPIEYPESLRTDYQEYKVVLKANSW